jgi:hypothetical protein
VQLKAPLLISITSVDSHIAGPVYEERSSWKVSSSLSLS